MAVREVLYRATDGKLYGTEALAEEADQVWKLSRFADSIQFDFNLDDPDELFRAIVQNFELTPRNPSTKES